MKASFSVNRRLPVSRRNIQEISESPIPWNRRAARKSERETMPGATPNNLIGTGALPKFKYTFFASIWVRHAMKRMASENSVLAKETACR
jgi:hypothetical protein